MSKLHECREESGCGPNHRGVFPDLNVNLHTNRVLQTHSRTSTTSRETHNRTHRNSPTHVNPSREHQGSATFTHTHSLTHVALTHSRRISPAPSATSPARLIALDVALLELEEVRVRRVWRVVRCEGARAPLCPIRERDIGHPHVWYARETVARHRLHRPQPYPASRSADEEAARGMR